MAASEVHELDERRRSLAEANPLLAKNMDLPPVPKVEDITFEHISLNLPALAKNALEELEANYEVSVPNEDNRKEESLDMNEADEDLETSETNEMDLEADEGLSMEDEAKETPEEEYQMEEDEPFEDEEEEQEEDPDEDSKPN